MALLARLEGFLSREDHSHGAAGSPHQQRQERLDSHVLLAAEPAAHIGRDDTQAAVRQPEDLGKLASMLDDLRRDP